MGIKVVVEGLANDYSGSSHEYGSLMRLYMKVNILEQYLEGVESGELPQNADLMRQVKLIVQKLPEAPEPTLNATAVGKLSFFYERTTISDYRNDGDSITGQCDSRIPADAAVVAKVRADTWREETGSATASFAHLTVHTTDMSSLNKTLSRLNTLFTSSNRPKVKP